MRLDDQNIYIFYYPSRCLWTSKSAWCAMKRKNEGTRKLICFRVFRYVNDVLIVSCWCCYCCCYRCCVFFCCFFFPSCFVSCHFTFQKKIDSQLKSVHEQRANDRSLTQNEYQTIMFYEWEFKFNILFDFSFFVLFFFSFFAKLIGMRIDFKSLHFFFVWFGKWLTNAQLKWVYWRWQSIYFGWWNITVKSIVDLDGLLDYTPPNDAEEIALTNRNSDIELNDSTTSHQQNTIQHNIHTQK